MPLHRLDGRSIDQSGHADDVEKIDPIGGTVGLEQRVQLLLKCRVGRADDRIVVALDADDMGVRPTIVVELSNGIAKQRAPIETAIVAFVIGEALELQRLVSRTARRPADKRARPKSRRRRSREVRLEVPLPGNPASWTGRFPSQIPDGTSPPAPFGLGVTSFLASRAKDGGRDRDRTCDPYHVKVVLSR